VVWAGRTAQRLLADEMPCRWAHTQGVAATAVRVGRRVLSPPDRPVLVAAAWLHDIGYATQLRATEFHQLDGAQFLARSGIPHRICGLVAQHSGAAAVVELLGLGDQLAQFPDEHGPLRDCLWYCDMTTSPTGHRVTFPQRLTEIRARRGSHDPVVRALAINGPERAAAVQRTEHRLRQPT
jgi:putative nucleotidyltransferase with HDIG domain